jgi:hypothetical protein
MPPLALAPSNAGGIAMAGPRKRFLIKDLLVQSLPSDPLERRAALIATTDTPLCCPFCSAVSLAAYCSPCSAVSECGPCSAVSECDVCSAVSECGPCSAVSDCGPCSAVSYGFADVRDPGQREVLREQLQRILDGQGPMGADDIDAARERGLKPKTKAEAQELKQQLQDAIAEIDKIMGDLP